MRIMFARSAIVSNWLEFEDSQWPASTCFYRSANDRFKVNDLLNAVDHILTFDQSTNLNIQTLPGCFKLWILHIA
ncbi:hypothetical protein MIZ03_2224 [Rhodoferax lithotrophicus]|uniref:Uncharacterized protein n=1 Tax=Rhodoferax lithotrophicus TaxID=2798804 RepID=A0ABM7MLZ3_9BURK|nr:hypothetical protein MIZ03_2224 [Rhodoferax sp. MIZ03]